MKKRLKIPKYSSELFSIKYITIENNSLGIRGNCYDEDYNLGYEGAVSGFTSSATMQKHWQNSSILLTCQATSGSLSKII